MLKILLKQLILEECLNILFSNIHKNLTPPSTDYFLQVFINDQYDVQLLEIIFITKHNNKYVKFLKRIYYDQYIFGKYYGKQQDEVIENERNELLQESNNFNVTPYQYMKSSKWTYKEC